MPDPLLPPGLTDPMAPAEPPAWAEEQLKAWLAGMSGEAPATPPIDPFGLNPVAQAAMEGAAPPAVQLGAPRPVTGDMSPEERAAVGAAPQVRISDVEEIAPPLPDGLAALAPPPPIDAYGQLGAPETAPDAITAAGGFPAPEPPVEMPAAYANPLEDPGLDPWGRATAYADLLATEPERAMRIKAELEEGRRGLTLDRQIKAEREAADRAHAIADMRLRAAEKAQRDTAQLQADATALARERIDPEGWWNSRSTGQTIAGIAAAFIGGLVQGRAGGRNIGLDLITQAIERDIAAQGSNLAHRRDMLGVRRQSIADGLARAGDVAEAADLYRIASYKRIEQQLETERQQYQPGGTRDIRFGEMLADNRAKQARAAEDFRRRRQEDEIKAGEHNLKVDAAMLAREKHRDEMALKAAKLGAAGSGLLSPAYIKQEFKIDVDRPMSQKDVNARLEGKTKAQELAKGAPATDLSKDQLERVIPGITLPDGKPFFAVGDETESKKLRATVADTRLAVNFIDKLIEKRAKYGWSSDFFKSDEWRQMKSDEAFLKLTSKGEGVFALGVLTGPDVGIISDATQAGDTTEVRDMTAGLLEARKNFIDSANVKLRDIGGYPKGAAPPLDIPLIDTTQKPGQAQIHAAFKSAVETTKSRTDPVASAVSATAGGIGVKTLEEAAMRFASSSPDLKGEATQALRLLEDLVQSANSDGIREAARDALQRVRTARIPFDRPAQPERPR